MPPEGMDRGEYLTVKFGNEARSDRVYGAIDAAGKSMGVNFRFDRIERIPSSIDSHRLVRYANRHGQAGEAVEALYQAYFFDGRDTGNRLALYDIGEELGFDTEALRRYYYSDEDCSDILDQNARAHRLGVSGVPAFIVDGQFSVSGAQEPQVLARLLDIAEERQRERDILAAGSLPVLSD